VLAPRAIPALRIVIALGLVGALTSCGSQSSSPTSVANPTVTVSSVSVSGTAPVVGANTQFAATATLSNGTTSSVSAQATWSSSNTAIAIVSSSAIVTGVAAGEVDITATYQGVTGRSHLTIAKPEASTYTIMGTVTDETSGGVLPNINVQATDSRQNSTSTVTDSSGSYSISVLAAGRVTIVASAISYQTTQLTASISANTRLDIVLKRTVCRFTLSGTSFSFGSSGGTGTVTLATQSTGCAWTSRSNDAFITVSAGSSGIDNGTVTFSVAANTGSARAGTLTIAGQTVSVNQAAVACIYALSPTSVRFFDIGGTATVTVTASSACAWTAVSNASFITVTSGASGSGNGSVTFRVPGFGGQGTRTGTLTIAGEMVTVTQNALCDIFVSPDAISIPAGGGTFSFAVLAPATCSWTAVSNSFFITITGGASGRGDVYG
jgi:hypothetical protein